MDKICGKCQYWCRKCASCSRGKISHCLDERDCWEEPTNETHLEGTEWHSLDQRGFPDAVVFANNGSPLDGTYKIRRYVPEQRCRQLEIDLAVAERARYEAIGHYEQVEKVAKEMLLEMYATNKDQSHIPEPRQDDFCVQLKERGVDV